MNLNLNKHAFTLIELLIVVSIIGALSAIGLISFRSINASVRDSERSSKIEIIKSALEKYYEKHGEYPGCIAMSQPPEVIAANTLVGIDPEVLKAPSGTSGTSSIIENCGDITTDDDKFAYIGDGTPACLTGNSCSKFTLKYLEEKTDTIISVVRQRTAIAIVSPPIPEVPTLPVVLDPPVGDTVYINPPSKVTCNAGHSEYHFRYRINDSTTWIEPGAWEVNEVDVAYNLTTQQGKKYGLQMQARCNYLGDLSATIDGEEAIYIAPIAAAPSAPTVSANTVGDTTTFSWTTPTCAVGTNPQYQYFYSVTPSWNSGWTAAATSPFNATTSTEDVTYSLYVQARCFTSATQSAWSVSSNTASYYRPAAAPIAPTLTASSPTNTSINLSWTAVSGATNYILQRDTNPSFTSPVQVVSQATTTTTSSGLSQGIIYYYRVNVTTASGTSDWSTSANATTTITAPSAPVIASPATSNATTTTWSWAPVTCAAGTTAQYQYDYLINSVSMAPAGWKTPTVPTSTSITFTTSTADVTYSVVTQARCSTTTSSAWSADSNTVSYYRPGAAPIAPTLTASSPTNTSINLSWTAVSGATNYILQRDTNSGFSAPVQIASQATTTFTSSSLNQGTQYYYRVNATTANGTSDWSASDNAITTIAVPSAPVIASPATSNATTTTWSWAPVTCAAGTTAQYQYDYLIDAVSMAPAGWKTPTTPTDTSISFTTVTEGHTYSVKTQARCYKDPVASAWSATSNEVGYTRVAAGSPYIQTITHASCPTTRTQVQDARDGHTYWIQKLADGKCWMLTNLGYAGGGTNTYGDVRTLTNSTYDNSLTYNVAKYYIVPSTTSFTAEPTAPSTSTDGTGQYGYLYNFCGANGGQAGNGACSNASTTAVNTAVSVCPAGWRLPTGNGGEFAALNTAINGGRTDTDAGLIGAPWLAQRGGLWNIGFSPENIGYYWSSTQYSTDSAYDLYLTSDLVSLGNLWYKYFGFPVRCLANISAPITAIAAISGTTTVWQTLTAGALTPAGAIATYQWQSATTADGTYTNISGATSSTYTLVAGDLTKYLKVVATGTNGYSGTVTSAASSQISSGPSPYIQTITDASCPTTRTQVKDARDGHTYWIQKLADGKCWMLTNLAYAGGGTNTYGDVKTLTNATGGYMSFTDAYYYDYTTNFTIEPTAPSTSTDGTGQYGYLYNFCGANGGQIGNGACSDKKSTVVDTTISVCPAGWRLPTGNGGEFAALNTAINGGRIDTDAGLIGTPWLGQRGGDISSGLSGFRDQGSEGGYWSSTQYYSREYAHYLGIFAPQTIYNDKVDLDGAYSKDAGFSVRCIAI